MKAEGFNIDKRKGNARKNKNIAFVVKIYKTKGDQAGGTYKQPGISRYAFILERLLLIQLWCKETFSLLVFMEV